MNIGIMHFPSGARPGSIEAMQQAVTHLSQESNLRRVDQGPINYRWKHGAGDWKWKRQLYPFQDASGGRLCGLVNGTVVGGVLPSAQFCNTLTFSVLKLWEHVDATPFAVHATWMRQQLEPFKLMRLREEKLFHDVSDAPRPIATDRPHTSARAPPHRHRPHTDAMRAPRPSRARVLLASPARCLPPQPPEWYGTANGSTNGESSLPRAGFLTYEPKLPPALTQARPPPPSLPLHPLTHSLLATRHPRPAHLPPPPTRHLPPQPHTHAPPPHAPLVGRCPESSRAPRRCTTSA